MENLNNINSVMKILEKHYSETGRTTLNQMRLNNEEAFKILISCLLSLRTQDKNTEIASNNLFAVADTPEGILKIPIRKLEKLIYKSGHYKKKSRILKSVSQEILKRFNGKVPDTREELLSIKFVGPKTANIVLSFAFGQLVIPVDVNVHRIANRLGWANTKLAEKTELELNQIIPKKYWRELNGIFILHGKTICVPISPKCSICPIKDLCPKIGVKRSR